MVIEQRVEDVIREALSSRGIEIVRIKFSSRILQIMIEKEGGSSVSIGDCEKITKVISLILDTEDIITSNYYLEVSSPGIDRPLVKLRDYERFQGEETKITLLNSIDDKKKIKGIISKVIDNLIYIQTQDSEIEIQFENILSANLITKINFNKKN